jgi:hypothetical protein
MAEPWRIPGTQAGSFLSRPENGSKRENVKAEGGTSLIATLNSSEARAVISLDLTIGI